MSDTERLEAAAAKLERVANLATPGPWQRTPSGAVYHHHPHGGTTGVTNPMARGTDAAFITTMDPTAALAVAALLRRVGNDADLAPHVTDAALAVADAVLGVPASPKEQAP